MQTNFLFVVLFNKISLLSVELLWFDLLAWDEAIIYNAFYVVLIVIVSLSVVKVNNGGHFVLPVAG